MRTIFRRLPVALGAAVVGLASTMCSPPSSPAASKIGPTVSTSTDSTSPNRIRYDAYRESPLFHMFHVAETGQSRTPAGETAIQLNASVAGHQSLLSVTLDANGQLVRSSLTVSRAWLGHGAKMSPYGLGLVRAFLVASSPPIDEPASLLYARGLSEAIVRATSDPSDAGTPAAQTEAPLPPDVREFLRVVSGDATSSEVALRAADFSAKTVDVAGQPSVQVTVTYKSVVGQVESPERSSGSQIRGLADDLSRITQGAPTHIMVTPQFAESSGFGESSTPTRQVVMMLQLAMLLAGEPVVSAVVFDGRLAHAIALRDLTDDTSGVLYHDPWNPMAGPSAPPRSFLQSGNNAVGTSAEMVRGWLTNPDIDYFERWPLWRVKVDDLARILYGIVLSDRSVTFVNRVMDALNEPRHDFGALRPDVGPLASPERWRKIAAVLFRGGRTGEACFALYAAVGFDSGKDQGWKDRVCDPIYGPLGGHMPTLAEAIEAILKTPLSGSDARP